MVCYRNFSDVTDGTSPGGGSSAARTIILDEFSDANNLFVLEDEFATRSDFLDISSISLLKDTITDSWEMNTVSNILYPIDELSVQRIQVSKAIKNTSSGLNARLIESPNDIFSGQKIEESRTFVDFEKFTLFPNPTSNSLNISVIGEGKYNYFITNVLGEFFDSGSFTKMIQINTEELNGIYFIEIVDELGKSSVKKLVVNN
jgi:hypothetical protein